VSSVSKACLSSVRGLEVLAVSATMLSVALDGFLMGLMTKYITFGLSKTRGGREEGQRREGSDGGFLPKSCSILQ
jgi:hypothetical protein